MQNVHPTAQIEQGASIDPSARVWHFCHVREGAVLEPLVSLGRDVYVDKNVRLRRGTRVQNGVSLYFGLEIEPWCFIGPHAIFTNDPYPRAGKREWNLEHTHLGTGASVGAGCVIRCGVRIGEFAMLGAGAIVTKNVSAFHLATGTPAHETKVVCACGETRMPLGADAEELVRDCCERLLQPELLDLAKAARARYQKISAS